MPCAMAGISTALSGAGTLLAVYCKIAAYLARGEVAPEAGGLLPVLPHVEVQSHVDWQILAS